MCNFSITFTGSASALTTKAQNQVNEHHGTFSGDTSAGNFDVPTPVGDIAGSYTISGQQLDVTISKKPFLVSCNAIQNYVEENLG